MCGIAGLLSPPGSPGPPSGMTERMTDALVHRGPDHGAVRVYGRCALGYRRLGVVDLGATGLQPVSDESGDVTAVLNGELYSFRALRDELEAAGHRVPGTGDTQVLPHVYEEHGLDFVHRLDGMFAVALWDARRERLVLARDRLGKKPLVWTRLDDGTLAFASEAKALAALPSFDRSVDLAALDAFLALGYVPPDRSAFASVRKVPPGHLLVVEDGRERLVRYWRAEPAELELSEGEWLEAVRAELSAAVRRRLVSDVPLGALLSGGIDSSVVLALMAEHAAGPIKTFSIGFPDARYDERRYARLVAERYGTEHVERVVDPDAASLLPRLAWAYDEPFADSSALPMLVVSEVAREHITVALTGDGGDETFAGYERYPAHRAAGFVPPAAAGRVASLLRRTRAGREEPRSGTYRAARFLEVAAAPADERYGRIVELFPPALRRALWSGDALASLAATPSAAALLGAPRQPGLTGLQLLDIETYLPGDLLVKADIASMACSLELRSPFLDHRVVELGLALPERLKRRGTRGKVALRRAFADALPDEVRARGKRGFGVPVSRWLRDELAGHARDVLLDPAAERRGHLRRDAVERLLADHASGRADHGARIWALLVLELWHRRYVDDLDPAPAEPAVARG